MNETDGKRTRDRVEIVAAWHAALNRGDAETVAALAHDDVEIGGPRGASRGAAVLREWVGRAGIRLEPIRWFARGPEIVVEERASWRGEDGQPGEPQIVATWFRVDQGRVRRIARHADLAAALTAAGLTPDDELEERT
jgi:hypothetical protein